MFAQDDADPRLTPCIGHARIRATLSPQALRIANGAAVNGSDAARKYVKRRTL